MIGDVLYTIRELKPAEHRLVEEQIKASKQRIVWQQFFDGFPTYRHYGVDLGDGSIVHFRGDLNFIQVDAWIQQTGIREFAKANKVYKAKEVRACFTPEEVAERALSMLGSDFGGYHFLSNNCEHFATWCACNRRISQQVLFREI